MPQEVMQFPHGPQYPHAEHDLHPSRAPPPAFLNLRDKVLQNGAISESCSRSARVRGRDPFYCRFR